MTQPHVLVINCGSSSIKLALIKIEPDQGSCPWQALAERLGSDTARLTIITGAAADSRTSRTLPGADHQMALDAALAELPDIPLAAVGHRVVHGGELFARSVVLDEDAIAQIRACNDLAPLHNPANLIGIEAARSRRPNLCHVAVFDTAFHQTLPAYAYHYAIPHTLYETHKIRRYGFHGTSHSYVGERAAQLLGRPFDAVNLITAHLGNGASATAIACGRSVDTTMGLTPLEGLVMGTRSGDVDPNLHLFLAERADMSLSEVTELLNKQSGLLGLSGESNDMRNLLQLEAAGHARAHLAIEIFCYRLAKALLGLCAALPCVDAFVFTGGIGENSAAVRARTMSRLSWLGVSIDPELNEANGRNSQARIHSTDSRVPILVVPTHEELVIAREALRLADS